MVKNETEQKGRRARAKARKAEALRRRREVRDVLLKVLRGT
jgi:hypothetical protein